MLRQGFEYSPITSRVDFAANPGKSELVNCSHIGAA
jgi:hypothetical protein